MKLIRLWVVFLLLSSCNPQPSSIDKVIEAFKLYQNTDTDQNWDIYDSKKVEIKHLELQSIFDQLKAVSYNKLSKADQINYDMLHLVIKDQIDEVNYQAHLMPLNAEGGFLTGMMFRFRNFSISDEESFEKYLSLLKGLPEYLAGQKLKMQNGLENNQFAPDLVINNSISILKNQLVLPEEECFLASPINGLSKEKREQALHIIREKALPALREMNNFLEGEYASNLRKGPGIMYNPEGKKYYEARVKYFTTLDMSPEEVFKKGQAEVKRIRGEMLAIIEKVGFEGNYADFLAFLRTDPQFYSSTGEQLLKEAAWLSKKAEEILPRYFTKLPRLPFTVNPVPSAIAPNYTTGRYSGGSFDKQKPGEYWVNTYKLESRPLYVLPALTLHEAVPGHHLQISLAAELENLPDFRKNTYLSAFGEGWGLYSEYLGKEAGIYRTPYEDFGRLTYEMWRACRLVVDPGIHYFGWTREQAVQFMAENTALSLHEVNTEIDRYIGWPAQAVSYKIGELKIRELRKIAEEALGENFDIRTFHDEILKNGSIPLRSLERVIRDYIDKEKIKHT
jgi:uncharacterized protein (DUF885 family)